MNFCEKGRREPGKQWIKGEAELCSADGPLGQGLSCRGSGWQGLLFKTLSIPGPPHIGMGLPAELWPSCLAHNPVLKLSGLR